MNNKKEVKSKKIINYIYFIISIVFFVLAFICFNYKINKIAFVFICFGAAILCLGIGYIQMDKK
ncbi:MAG: hypothetical protein ACI4XR_04270 [Bacilli bacterium]